MVVIHLASMKSVLFRSGSLIHHVGDLFYKLCAEASLVSKQGSYLGRPFGQGGEARKNGKILETMQRQAQHASTDARKRWIEQLG